MSINRIIIFIFLSGSIALVSFYLLYLLGIIILIFVETITLF